ncbi:MULTISPECIES: hypothetical protein [unclassified Roseibium]|uniref:PAS domain-containing protein n=1 Tax=unclassified Roseibium TaxID=2629323 RepID=UPI00273EAA23|nr:MULTISPECIES: hypothetical protein [unclassified Roseibium]
MSELDPTRLTPDELRNEWSIREEELRLQNEQLRETERKISEIAERFEVVFQHIPLPIILLDRRAFVQDANTAAYKAFPAIAAMKNYFLPRLITDASKAELMSLLEDESRLDPTQHTIEFNSTHKTHRCTLLKLPNDSQVHAALVLDPL